MFGRRRERRGRMGVYRLLRLSIFVWLSLHSLQHPVKPHPKINKDRAFEQLKMVMKHHPAFEPDSIQDRLKRLTGMLHDCTRRTPWSKLLWQVSRSE